MENHPRVSHLQKVEWGKVRMKSVRKFHTALFQMVVYLCRHISSRWKKYMETELLRDSEGEYLSLYARAMKVRRDTPVGARTHLHFLCIEVIWHGSWASARNMYTDRSVWGRMPFKKGQFLGHVSIRREGNSRAKALLPTLLRNENSSLNCSRAGFVKRTLNFLLRMINVKDLVCIEICLLIWLKYTFGVQKTVQSCILYKCKKQLYRVVLQKDQKAAN